MWKLPQIYVLALGRDFFPKHEYHSRHESHARDVWPPSTESSVSLLQIGHIHSGFAEFALTTSSTRSHVLQVKYFFTRNTSRLGSMILAGRRSGQTSTSSLSICVPVRAVSSLFPTSQPRMTETPC